MAPTAVPTPTIPPVAITRMKARSTTERRRSRPGTIPCGLRRDSDAIGSDCAEGASGVLSSGAEEVTWRVLGSAIGSPSRSGWFVGILLPGKLEGAVDHVREVALLDGQCPCEELLDVVTGGPLVEGAEHQPMAHLTGFGHREELETIERVGVVAEVGLHHLARLGLRLAGLVEDRR